MSATLQRRIHCGICGGIAAYKAAEVVSRLVKAGHDVSVVMTRAACRFIAPLTFQALTRRPVAVEMFPRPSQGRPEDIFPHIYPATDADAFIVLPATADMLAKLAHGQADDLVSAAALTLSEHALRIICPAMNSAMWNNPAVRRNVASLEKDGWIRIGPNPGPLACGGVGPGRLAEPDEIVSVVLRSIGASPSLANRSVLICSGPTREYFDTVRFISNASTGRMGRAIAEEAAARGAHVTFVTGPVAPSQLPQRENIEIINVTSASDMLQAASAKAAGCDLILMPAAVADFRPAVKADHKQPRHRKTVNLTLEPTPDIAATLAAQRRQGQVLIGFALQENNDVEAARRKLIEKKLDAVIVNSPAAVGAEESSYLFLSADRPQHPDDWGRLRKTECARRILEAAESLLAEKKRMPPE